MGFLLAEGPQFNKQEYEDSILHKLECKACPLDHTCLGRHRKMPATGAEKPLVYILGEAPGAEETKIGEQFVGESGQLLRARIPIEFEDRVRFNNTIQCRPPGNRNPDRNEIECCRARVVRDIEEQKPKAILGFGNIPLNWISGLSGITGWRGRRMPVKVGSHTCWYYPILHPAFILRQRRNKDDAPDAIGSEDERMFVFDLKRAFEEVETIPDAAIHTLDDVYDKTEIINTFGPRGIRKIEDALSWALEEELIGIDYETNCLRPFKAGAKILTAAVGNANRSFAFPFDHRQAKWTDKERREIGELWKEFLEIHTGIKAAHNLAFELEWTAAMFGKELVRAGRWECSAVQAAIIDERRGKQKPGPFSLDFLVFQYFGFNLKIISNLDRSKLDDEPLDKVLMYNTLDAKYHALLWEEQERRIEQDGLEAPYGLALRRVPTVVLSQLKGVPVNQKEVQKLRKKYKGRKDDLTEEFFDLKPVRDFQKRYSREFNWQSNKDVADLLEHILQREEIWVTDKYTKKSKRSADENVLKKIDHPFSELLLKLRKTNHRLSTYIEPLMEGSPDLYPDGLLHAIFNTFFAETGRLSCEGPNLQNFPKRDDEAKEVRKPIEAPPGCTILAFDYGQIEARVIAMFTKDEVFCKSLWDRYDVHMEWAERIAHAYPKRIGGKQNLKDKKALKTFRTDIKNQWTFPLFFGASLKSASDYLSIPQDVVKPLYEEFWKQFSGVADWQESQMKFYQEHGYTETLTGRRRHGPMSPNKIYNTPVQGTAAEIVMDGMCRISELNDWELQPEINIHDDLTFLRVPVNRVEELAEKIVLEMLNVPFPWINVPITIEVSEGPNWMEMEEIAAFSSDEWGR